VGQIQAPKSSYRIVGMDHSAERCPNYWSQATTIRDSRLPRLDGTNHHFSGAGKSPDLHRFIYSPLLLPFWHPILRGLQVLYIRR